MNIMDIINIDINNLVLRLGLPLSQIRAKSIVNNAISILEELLKNHAFEYSTSVTGFQIDTLKVPSISIKEGESDKEISKTIAQELHYTLIKNSNF
jgi:hypothetical protein